jgi:hypothetical protein
VQRRERVGTCEIESGRSSRVRRDRGGIRYGAGNYTLTDSADPKDIEQLHALRDAIKVDQQSPGRFKVPDWDQASQKRREALLVLASTLSDTNEMFGTKDQVDPMRRVPEAAIRGRRACQSVSR